MIRPTFQRSNHIAPNALSRPHVLFLLDTRDSVSGGLYSPWNSVWLLKAQIWSVCLTFIIDHWLAPGCAVFWPIRVSVSSSCTDLQQCVTWTLGAGGLSLRWETSLPFLIENSGWCESEACFESQTSVLRLLPYCPSDAKNSSCDASHFALNVSWHFLWSSSAFRPKDLFPIWFQSNVSPWMHVRVWVYWTNWNWLSS